ncbi:MAG: hypothetical protein HY046_06205 [Acidobacteria bacterium]|nr:hypothetical protein [Acidobacteriota bacterium]
MAGLTTVVCFGAGCAVSKKTKVEPALIRPAMDATLPELVERYNRFATAVRSVNLTVELRPVAGSTYSGVIEEYHQIRGFILAQRPSSIRMIGQAPVVSKNIFDMVSDGETFHIFIPPKNKFIVGPANLERPATKPIENLRPQHLIDALFWKELTAQATLFIEELDASPERYYVLTELRGSVSPEIARKIWFDRIDLQVARVQTFAAGGRMVTDVKYADWQAAPPATAFPYQIDMRRPHDDYSLGITVTKVSLNEEIAADRFKLEQPAGTELVRVTEAPRKEGK